MIGNSVNFRKHILSHKNARPNYWGLFQQNRLPTIYYFICFTMFGMCIGILGPSLPHLQCQINATQSSMTIIFFVQLAVLLIATAASGSIVKIMDPHLLLLINCLMLMINTYLIMVARSVSDLALILIVMGFNMGCIDSVSNVMVVNVFKLDVAPFIQIMHFLYGFGALITQLSIDPFLQYLSTNCTRGHLDIQTQIDIDNRQIKILSYPFWIIGTIELIMFIVLIIVYNLLQLMDSTNALKTNVNSSWDNNNNNNISNINNTGNKPMLEQNSSNNNNQNQTGSKVKSKGYLHCCIVILVAGLCLVLDGMQSEFNLLVYSYAVNSGANEAERSYDSFLNFTFWGTLTLGRFVAVIIAIYFRAFALLSVDAVGLFLGVLMLACGQGNGKVLYASTCVIGISLSNMTPGVISLAEEFINLTKWRTTFIIFSASLGEAFIPLIFGTLMDNVGPVVFPVGNVVLILLVLGNFFTLYKLGITTVKFAEKSTKSVIDVPTPGETIHVKHYSRMDSVDNV